ncbi:hypothetical protein A2U01_0030238 [Trifolium medium]|uniref:Uncharacterized protein n=1 Tax=Trifolium medium TaxID=97028 RepID=A0A392PE61_9FABA|nr:hypothetical protein [Trifolium medium]
MHFQRLLKHCTLINNCSIAFCLVETVYAKTEKLWLLGSAHPESDVPEALLQNLDFRGQQSRVWPKLPESDLQTVMDSSEACLRFLLLLNTFCLRVYM